MDSSVQPAVQSQQGPVPAQPSHGDDQPFVSPAMQRFLAQQAAAAASRPAAEAPAPASAAFNSSSHESAPADDLPSDAGRVEDDTSDAMCTDANEDASVGQHNCPTCGTHLIQKKRGRTSQGLTNSAAAKQNNRVGFMNTAVVQAKKRVEEHKGEPNKPGYILGWCTGSTRKDSVKFHGLGCFMDKGALTKDELGIISKALMVLTYDDSDTEKDAVRKWSRTCPAIFEVYQNTPLECVSDLHYLEELAVLSNEERQDIVCKMQVRLNQEAAAAAVKAADISITQARIAKAATGRNKVRAQHSLACINSMQQMTVAINTTMATGDPFISQPTAAPAMAASPSILQPGIVPIPPPINSMPAATINSSILHPGVVPIPPPINSMPAATINSSMPQLPAFPQPSLVPTSDDGDELISHLNSMAGNPAMSQPVVDMVMSQAPTDHHEARMMKEGMQQADYKYLLNTLVRLAHLDYTECQVMEWVECQRQLAESSITSKGHGMAQPCLLEERVQ